MNPLLTHLLADSPPVFRTAVGSAAGGCVECGLTVGGSVHYRVGPDGHTRCPVCCLGLTAAWDAGRVRLALIPEFAQGPLNALCIQVATMLQADTAPPVAPTTAESIHRQAEWHRQHHLLAAVRARVVATHAVLPFTATPFILRQTLLALPVTKRNALLPALVGLRYVMEPDDQALVHVCRAARGATPRCGANP